MNGTQKLHRITVGLDQMRLEAALEEMAATSVAAVEADRIGRLKPPDCLAQVCFRRFQHQMIMVRHQAKGMHEAAELTGTLGRALAETARDRHPSER